MNIEQIDSKLIKIISNLYKINKIIKYATMNSKQNFLVKYTTFGNETSTFQKITAVINNKCNKKITRNTSKKQVG